MSNLALTTHVLGDFERTRKTLEEIAVPGRPINPVEIRMLLAEVWIISDQLEELAERLRPLTAREHEGLDRRERRGCQSRIALAVRILIGR
jgi:hypothetical protein